MKFSSSVKLGLVAGSGPEAGVDLWNKVLGAVRSRLGRRFQGDLDAPYMEILSVPRLGLSMDLAKNEAEVWEALQEAVQHIGRRVDYYVIACNTLYYFARRIEGLNLPGRLVSPTNAVAGYVRDQGLTHFALLGAKPVMRADRFSAYKSFSEMVDPVPADLIDEIHGIVLDVKQLGPGDEALVQRWQGVLKRIKAQTVLLACTELPLINAGEHAARCVDVSALLAATLADHFVEGTG